MGAPSSFRFALACGVAGAWTEVTDDVLWDNNVTYQWGKKSAFDQSTRPGMYSFTLKNEGGKYSPANPLSTLATPLVEGMGANWELHGVQRSGTIRSVQVYFPDGGKVDDSARVRVTVDDMLGNAARHQLTDMSLEVFRGARGLLRWSFEDEVGSAAARESEQGADFGWAPGYPFGLVQFGASSTIPVDKVLLWTGGASQSGIWQASNAKIFAYGGVTMGSWSFWFETSDALGSLQVGVFNTTGVMVRAVVASTISVTGLVSIAGPPVKTGTAYFVEMVSSYANSSTTAVTWELFVNGISYGTDSMTRSTADSARFPAAVTVSYDTGQYFISHLTHTMARAPEFALGNAAAQQRIAAIAATTPEVVMDTVPPMSPAILGEQGGSTTLGALDEVLRGEQGGMMTLTSGPLLAPVQKVATFARDRKRPVDLTIPFSAIQGQPEFVRALTNTVYRATADGPETSATATDPSAFALVGSASTSDSVTLRDYSDLYAYAGDRIYRGKNAYTPIVAFTIDARSLDLNLWSSLLALRVGHRIRLTGCPVAQLGYSTWDGWVVGGDETHTGETRSLFTINVQPAWDVPVYGTARYAAGGTSTLSSGITAGATSMSIASTGTLWTTNPAHFPMNVIVDREEITISAISGASSPQTATISARGVGTAPAASHASGATVEPSPVARYDF